MRGTVPYNPSDSEEFYAEYYKSQTGNGVSVFSGRTVMPPKMNGNGLGSAFSGLFRAALPMFKKGAKLVGKHAIEAGRDILSDVASGKNFSSSFRRRGKEEMGEMLGEMKASFLQKKAQKAKKRRKNLSSYSYPSKKAKKTIFN